MLELNEDLKRDLTRSTFKRNRTVFFAYTKNYNLDHLERKIQVKLNFSHL